MFLREDITIVLLPWKIGECTHHHLDKTFGSGHDTRVRSEPQVHIQLLDHLKLPTTLFTDCPKSLLILLLEMIPRSVIFFFREFIHPEYISLIFGLKYSCLVSLDGYVWNYTKLGVYSVKSGYEVLRSTKLQLIQDHVLEPVITCLQSHV